MTKNQKNFILMPGTITGFLIVLFLNGYIVDFPQGTKEGGLYAALGVLVIMLLVFSIFTLLHLFQKKRKEL